jgi:hypothetical protein
MKKTTKTTKRKSNKPPIKKKGSGHLATTAKKNAMIAALTKSLGIISAACKQVNIARITHYEWMKTDEKYRQAVEEINESAVDFAEGKLLHKINTGDTIATIFYLKTKGKSRGYIEKTEVDNNLKTTQPIIIDWSGNDRNEAESN